MDIGNEKKLVTVLVSNHGAWFDAQANHDKHDWRVSVRNLDRFRNADNS